MSSVLITVYDEATGEYLRQVSCPASQTADQCEEGQGYALGFYDEQTRYRENDTDKARPEMSCSLVDTTLSNLPVPCAVTIQGEVIEVPDGSIEFSFELPGTYPVKVEAWPYQDWEGVINAV